MNYYKCLIYLSESEMKTYYWRFKIRLQIPILWLQIITNFLSNCERNFDSKILTLWF